LTSGQARAQHAAPLHGTERFSICCTFNFDERLHFRNRRHNPEEGGAASASKSDNLIVMAEQTKFAVLWAQYGRALLIFCVFALFLHDMFGTHGYLAMRRTKSEIERVQSDIKRLTKENAELSDEVKLLRTDPHKIESIARDELGLAKPNEVIIKIPESQQSTKP